MEQLLVGLAILVGGGIVSLFYSRSARLANWMGGSSAAIGSLVAAIPAIRVLLSGRESELFSRPWQLPFASFAIQLDSLSAWFAAIILGFSALAAIYGIEYMSQFEDRKSIGAAWLFFNLLVAMMTLVVAARDGMLFLLAWEGMALSSYFLVAFEDEKASVRDAGRVYLIASHLGVAFVLAFFVLLDSQAGTLSFAGITEWGQKNLPASRGISTAMFLLAIVGFGTKAGFIPLHVWLPVAHPAAPSHVSAVMSAVMIKCGIYGILRTLLFLGHPPVWWGWLLVGIGATSGLLGVMFALAQHDLKRLLAYSSVENVGIIALGLGIGVLGVSLDQPAMAVLGFAGGLLHVLNHAVFKGLLFLGAGTVLHGTHTTEIDRLGGLIKRMPWTAGTFLIGAVAICGLPPLNGFVSEFLIYLGAFQGDVISDAVGSVAALTVIGMLAAIGGLAAACFTKAFGVVFLGEPRSPCARDAHEPGLLMVVPMVLLGITCFAIGLGSSVAIFALRPTLSYLTHVAPDRLSAPLDRVASLTNSIAVLAGLLLAIIVVLTIVRRLLLSKREIGATPTWDCGYAAPSATMQYTSSSYAQPIVDFHVGLLQPQKHLRRPEGFFPDTASLETHTPDLFMDKFYVKLFQCIGWVAGKLAWIQHGRLSIYVLYIALALFALLAWYFGISEIPANGAR